LRALQRECRVAIALVHHVRKNGSPRGQDGQSLRGSGDLHAWGDSNLYLRRRERQMVLKDGFRLRQGVPVLTPKDQRERDEVVGQF
jgi:hypothetical protein